jgi:transcription-repair coupling factor (superfamily II helicase)
MEILIPDWYVNNVNERLILYRELDDIKNEFELEKFHQKLTDRFGPLPAATTELIETLRLRWLAKDIGFEKIVLKNHVLYGYFISKKDSPYYNSVKFTKVLNYFQKHHNRIKMEEKNDKLRLVFTGVKDIKQAITCIAPILNPNSALEI